MQFLAPLGFLALLAALLPIAIHLLSRKAGTIIKVGSLQFLTSSSSARFKSLQVSELALLLVRTTLVVLLAFLLARPVWLTKISGPTSSSAGWVLVAPELLHAPHRDWIRPVLDSLAAAGHELHLFSAGFPALSFSEAGAGFQEGQSWWSLLRELEQAGLASASIQVFAVNRLKAYHGERPKLQHKLVWKVFPALQRQPGDFIRLQPAPDSMRVAIVHAASRIGEAQYLQSALQVAAEAIPQILQLKLVSRESGEPPWMNFDLLFWLMEDSLPAAASRQIEHGLVVMTTASNKDGGTRESWIIMPQAGALSFPRLWRRSPATNRGVPIWTDGLGMPLLEAERQGQGWRYRFASRFDPVWNELVMHAAFPEWLLALLSREDLIPMGKPAPWDQRRISLAQSLPQEDKKRTAGETRSAAYALHFPIWLLAVLTFGIERWMSDRKSS
ncbi:MAG: BatA domain-containing protein [bacterium]